jgi:sulfofructose kinase
MNYDVVGLGNCAGDLVLGLERYPRAGERARARSLIRQGGGEVGTALVTLARLGARTGMVGKIGSDDWGRFILEEFRKDGVDTGGIVVEEGRQSLFALCLVEDDGQRTIVFHKDTGPLRPEDVNRDMVTSCRLLHLDQYEPEAGVAAAAWARQAGAQVALDIDELTERTAPLVVAANVVIGSATFGAAFDSDPARAAGLICQQGPSIAVITTGAEGCCVAAGREVFRVPGFAVDVVDTTGAGDVFHGAFLFGLLQQWPLEQTAAFANAAAALKCTRAGSRAAIPARAEIEVLVSRKR